MRGLAGPITCTCRIFGLAKGRSSAASLTRSGVNPGTVAYMAPEQIEGREVEGRTDQYALACAAFELLAGAVPFDRDQEVAVIYAHLSVPPPSLTALRPGRLRMAVAG
jgi:serine/threonine-protein kinase